MTRRAVLAGSGALGAAAVAKPGDANPAKLEPLGSTDTVYVPPRGRGEDKASFSWPEPSVAFAGLHFAFEVVGFDNVYAVDPALTEVTRGDDSLRLVARGLTWAGGEPLPGHLEANLRRAADGAIEWTVAGGTDRRVKSLKTVVRGLPRGRLSAAAGAWVDPGDDEQVWEYPVLRGGMATPLATIEGRDGKFWAISSRQQRVLPARFYFAPGETGYKVELIAEAAGWEPSNRMAAQPWRIASAPSFEAAVTPHFAAVSQAWKIPRFADRADAPAWMKRLALVLSLHGQHWTGKILNSFDRQREILRWAAERIDPAQVMVFLSGWDGRYYWDYPAFRTDRRMGGDAGFGRLIEEGRKLGFRFALMFGANGANPASPLYPPLAAARLNDLYGVPVQANYVDWDGDRKGDGSLAFMNLAVPAWRDHLAGRIDDMLRRFPIDAYFLDICGLWENNPDGDMHEGTRALVADLARRHPGVPAIAEMQYDAQAAFIPMSQVRRYALHPDANFGHVATYDHLSHGAPGRGSTGVHEAGFGRYKPVTADQLTIPTITFSDDTLSRYADLAAADIAAAGARFAARGGRT